MRHDLDYRKYNAEDFAQDHPEDPWLTEAELALTKELERAKGPQEGETALEATHRIDQAFDGLHTLFADRMAEYGRGEAAFMKVSFVGREVQEIWNRHLEGIEMAPSLEELAGGRFARDEEIRLFRERVNDNPTFLKERQHLADMQAVRSTAVSALIGRIHDATLERLGLDRLPQNELAQHPQKTSGVKDHWEANVEAKLRAEQAKLKERDPER